MKTTQIQAITTSQIQALTTNQIEALTTSQVEALTTTQTAALSSSQVSGHLALGTPIILDLNNDGIQTLSVSDGVKFDLFATGNKVNTGWVSGNDGLLVMDRNHDGQINDGSELFGSSTTLSTGQKAADGYAALRELDTNQDGVLNSKDAAFADLQVWVDANSDGITEAGELKSLASLGIAGISTQATVDLSKNNGNLQGLVSTYETTDGATHTAADVWFVADRQASIVPAAAADTTATAAPPPPPTEAQLASALDWGLAPAPAAPEPAKVALAPPPSDLRTQVSGLAQAISSFAGGSDESAKDALTRLPTSTNGPNTPTLAVVNMVDAMKQFDANGNLISKQTPLASPTPVVPGSALEDPTKSGLLASPTGKLPG